MESADVTPPPAGRVSPIGTASMGATAGSSHRHSPTTTDAVRWTVDPEWSAQFARVDSPDWTALTDDSRATLVKSNPVRRVWRVELRSANTDSPDVSHTMGHGATPSFRAATVRERSSDVGTIHRLTGGDRAVYVKEWLDASIRQTIRDRFRGPPARIEWRAGRWAVERGVPAVRHVAYGVGRGRSYLISPAIDGAARLADVWPANGSLRSGSDGRRADALIDAAARLLAVAHRNGFVHGDDHPRNILVVEHDRDHLECLYADLYAARGTDRTSDQRAAGALAQLNQWFRTRTAGTQRLRFLRAYCRLRCDGDDSAARALVRRLQPPVTCESHRQAARLWAKRDGRIWRTNAYFARVVVNAETTAQVVLSFRNPDRFPQPSIENRTVGEWRDELRAAVEGGRPGPHIVCGHGFERDGSRSIRRRFENAHRLRHRDLPCRWAVALVHGPGNRDMVWMDALPSATPLVSFLRDSLVSASDRALAAVGVARLIRRMSDRGVRINHWTGETFGVVAPGCRVLIECPEHLAIVRRRPERDLIRNVRIVGDWFRDECALGDSEILEFVRTFAPRDWSAIRATTNHRVKSVAPTARLEERP
ncbi:MAG: hypothetical protein HOP29_04640 [Phycisphaerales bacterium]|nr:hypothetical protein [Phycisphaerales bacterium]